MKEIPQRAIDTLPEGYVILGWGGNFKGGNEPFKGLYFWDAYGEKRWNESNGYGVSIDTIYAVLADSGMARLNGLSLDVPKKGKQSVFPEGAAERKTYPVGTFIKDYFPIAIAALAKHSYEAQKQHGEPTNGACMEWLRDKSIGDGNEIVRHFMEGDYEAMAWRALELLERELTE